MACTSAELTGCGSDATAASNAFFMMPIASGGNDAFEKSFMLGSAWTQCRASLSLSRDANEGLPLRGDTLPSPTPAAAPPTSPSATASKQSHDKEQQ
jgi:hypothetical protein